MLLTGERHVVVSGYLVFNELLMYGFHFFRIFAAYIHQWKIFGDVYVDESHLQNNLCNNCKRPGHFARECPNVAVCNNCGLPGHIALECTTQLRCWNCREPGHVASNCPNEGICHSCGKSGHRARDCPNPEMPPGDLRLCNNCYKPGHIAAECTNDKACKNCRKTGHIARDCHNEPVCNSCNIAGHVARQCPKGNNVAERGAWDRTSGYRDVVCRTCNQVGHMSRDCVGPMIICHNCGGRGHMALECPSGRFADRGFRRLLGLDDQARDGLKETAGSSQLRHHVEAPQGLQGAPTLGSMVPIIGACGFAAAASATGSLLALQWESENLIALSTAIKDWLASSTLNFYDYHNSVIAAIIIFVMECLVAEIAVQLMTKGGVLTILGSLLTALALPAAVLTATGLMDRKWAIGVDR
ncbi:hypothetical protein GH714_015910 [Hevea brasiliensis]|uniref:CCHC-type domain-containing protein n=1 Tax=Hevea brasiliensis TaxID=3981 RepID=A0A6A6NHL4_HEVBR|nr:hypothetical protein GH714_015910 [Hevea brasiliensis]